MSPEEPIARQEYEEYVVQEPDRMAQLMRYGIIFLVITILCVLAYALLTGVFRPPAPRTLIENSLLQAEAAVKQEPGNGKAWAALAAAYYAEGDKAQAWSTIRDARKRIKDRSILYLNLRELDFLLIEGRDKEVVEKADDYIEVEANYQMEERANNLQRGITVPDTAMNNVDAERLFVLKATAEGNLGQWSDAVKTLDYVLQLNDRAADVLSMRGWARLQSGDAAGAIQDFEQALKFMPDDPSAQAGLAKASEEASAAQ